MLYGHQLFLLPCKITFGWYLQKHESIGFTGLSHHTFHLMAYCIDFLKKIKGLWIITLNLARSQLRKGKAMWTPIFDVVGWCLKLRLKLKAIERQYVRFSSVDKTATKCTFGSPLQSTLTTQTKKGNALSIVEWAMINSHRKIFKTAIITPISLPMFYSVLVIHL